MSRISTQVSPMHSFAKFRIQLHSSCCRIFFEMKDKVCMTRYPKKNLIIMHAIAHLRKNGFHNHLFVGFWTDVTHVSCHAMYICCKIMHKKTPNIVCQPPCLLEHSCSAAKPAYPHISSWIKWPNAYYPKNH